MRYPITYRCGHQQTINTSGVDRARRLAVEQDRHDEIDCATCVGWAAHARAADSGDIRDLQDIDIGLSDGANAMVQFTARGQLAFITVPVEGGEGWWQLAGWWVRARLPDGVEHAVPHRYARDGGIHDGLSVPSAEDIRAAVAEAVCKARAA